MAFTDNICRAKIDLILAVKLLIKMAADKKRIVKLTLFNINEHHLFLSTEINSICKLKLKKIKDP